MRIIAVIIIACILSFGCGYFYGKNKQQTYITEKKAEVIKNVAQKRAKIQARPNADRDELLKLMRTGYL